MAITADLDAVRAQFPDIVAGMTGGPALAHAEETTTQHDMALASVLAITACVLLIVIPFRGLIEPLFTIIALLTGVAWSFGFTTIAGRPSEPAVGGLCQPCWRVIGINFPIHLMARYDEARRKGLAMPVALELAVVNTGIGVFASACIMALAFLMPMFTDFKGIADLDWFRPAALFMCLLSAMLVFPALIAIRDRDRVAGVRRSRSRPIARRSNAVRPAALDSRLDRARLNRRAFSGGGRPLRFRTWLKLQASEVEAVRFEIFCCVIRDAPPGLRSRWHRRNKQAEAKAAAFRRLDQVSDVETIETYIRMIRRQARNSDADRRHARPLAIRQPGATRRSQRRSAPNSPRLPRSSTSIGSSIQAAARSSSRRWPKSGTSPA